LIAPFLQETDPGTVHKRLLYDSGIGQDDFSTADDSGNLLTQEPRPSFCRASITRIHEDKENLPPPDSKPGSAATVKQGERRGVLTCKDNPQDKKKKRSIIAGPPALPERNKSRGKSALERLPGDESVSECIANLSADLFAGDLDPQVSALTLHRRSRSSGKRPKTISLISSPQIWILRLAP
jgi:hypothetical protein